MKKINIGILTFPISEAGNTPLSNLVDILHPLSNDIYLITGNEGYDFFKEDMRIHAYGIGHKSGGDTFTRIIRYIYTQLRISYKLAKITRKVDLWFFFIGGDALVLPMLIAKLFRKKVVLALAGSSAQSSKSKNDNLSKPVESLLKINYIFSDRIVLYSKNLIKEWNLEKYKNKILIAHHHFFDFEKFKIKKKFDARKNLVGYIGRLSEEKGVLNFVKAIPKVLEKENKIKFSVGGDGQLRNKIEEYLDVVSLNDKVKLPGWIPDDEFPDYLNELKVFVLPSYTEGLPYTLLEAMACGTPVLATPVGAIPDILTDGETGFVMKDNSPECIAENVVRALEHSDLERIVGAAKARVEQEFTYEAAVEKYRKILENI